MLKKLVLGILLLYTSPVYAQLAPPSNDPAVGFSFGHDGFINTYAGRAYFYNPQAIWKSGGWIFFWLNSTADFHGFTASGTYVECASRTSFKVATTFGNTSSELVTNTTLVSPVGVALPADPTNPRSILAASWCEGYVW